MKFTKKQNYVLYKEVTKDTPEINGYRKPTLNPININNNGFNGTLYEIPNTCLYFDDDITGVRIDYELDEYSKIITTEFKQGSRLLNTVMFNDFANVDSTDIDIEYTSLAYVHLHAPQNRQVTDVIVRTYVYNATLYITESTINTQVIKNRVVKNSIPVNRPLVKLIEGVRSGFVVRLADERVMLYWTDRDNRLHGYRINVDYSPEGTSIVDNIKLPRNLETLYIAKFDRNKSFNNVYIANAQPFLVASTKPKVIEYKPLFHSGNKPILTVEGEPIWVKEMVNDMLL